ncbi:hypothetical protein N7490_000251 [Penicillium lividum]|nr:hypothetical protein N7490_000251 [Penicillium lividum]
MSLPGALSGQMCTNQSDEDSNEYEYEHEYEYEYESDSATDTTIFFGTTADENHNIRTGARTTLLRKLHAVCGQESLPVPFWACLQLCSISKLKFTIWLAENWLDDFLAMAEIFRKLPCKWVERASIPPYIPYQTSEHTQSAARERDLSRCVLTGAEKPVKLVCIFPDSAVADLPNRSITDHGFWKLMYALWDPEIVKRWRNAIFPYPNNPTYAAINDPSFLISLRHDLSIAWVSGLFALRPVSVTKDKFQLEVEFHWLSHGDRDSSKFCAATETAFSTQGRKGSKEMTLTLTDKRGEPFLVASGHRFVLRTDDPVLRPLPSFELLDMQWYVNRIVAMAGTRELRGALSRSEMDAQDVAEEDKGCPKRLGWAVEKRVGALLSDPEDGEDLD